MRTHSLKPISNFKFISLLRISAIVAVGGLISACQSGGQKLPVLTLDEAKKITADFGGPVTPPPRTINEILRLFDGVEYDDKLCLYQKRPSEEEVMSAASSVQSQAPRSSQKARFLEEEAWSEFMLGNYSLAIRYLEEGLWGIPPKWQVHIARINAFKALLQSEIGDFSSASSSLGNTSYKWDSQSELINTQAKFYIQVSEAAISASKGDLKQAEAQYYRALNLSEPSHVMSFAEPFAYAQLSLAGIKMRQGHLTEAENMIREELKNWAPDTTPIVATGLFRLGEVLFEQGRFRDAEKIARLTIKIYKPICTKPENIQKAKSHMLLAKALVAQEQWAKAVEQFDIISSNMTADVEAEKRLFAGNYYRALAFLKSGRTNEALSTFRESLVEVESRLGSNSYQAAEIGGFLAMAELVNGKKDIALAQFSEAARSLIERERDITGDGEIAAALENRRNLIFSAYLDLLSEIRGTRLEESSQIDAAAEAFHIASVARSGQVGRALAASGARSTLGNQELEELARREQDTEKRLAALQGLLTAMISRPLSQQKSANSDLLKSKIANLQSARNSLQTEIESRFPKYSELKYPKALTLDDARKLLRPDEALITFYVAEHKTFVWAILPDGKAEFSTVNLGRQQMTETVNELRKALEPKITTLGDIPPFNISLAHDLYSKILHPVRAGWENARNLLIVSHGPLGYLPLSVLPTAPSDFGKSTDVLFADHRQVPWLARSHAITMLPSVSSLKSLKTRSAVAGTRLPFVGFGDPYFSPGQALAADQTEAQSELAYSGRAVRGIPVKLRNKPQTRAVDSASLALLPRLPATRWELTSIAKTLGVDPDKVTYTGRRASESRVKSMDLTPFKIVSFATHGLVPGDIDGLTQPALALASPKLAGSHEDGLLTTGEILGLRLNADWVVLSACNTASADGAGAEAVSGLGRAFFYAGARSLLVSNWPVHSGATAKLTTTLFYLQAKDPTLGRAEALQQTRIEMIDKGTQKDRQGRDLFSYAHPIFWAPFIIVGDGGGAQAGS